jgi:hypothetical protein
MTRHNQSRGGLDKLPDRQPVHREQPADALRVTVRVALGQFLSQGPDRVAQQRQFVGDDYPSARRDGCSSVEVGVRVD